jgi:hypothetical protein
VYTVTNNGLVSQITKEGLYKWHIQDLMQRTEMELQSSGGLAVMFLDPKDKPIDGFVRSAYATIYHEGDFIRKYLHITDSVTFVLSHQSFGVRIADYVVGIFNSFLRGYQLGTELFIHQVWPLIRKTPSGDPLGWGICEVPKDATVRGKIRERLVESGLLPDTEIEILF